MSATLSDAAATAASSWFPRTLVIGGLLAVALLLAATTIRGSVAGGDLRHDDRPVQLDR